MGYKTGQNHQSSPTDTHTYGEEEEGDLQVWFHHFLQTLFHQCGCMGIVQGHKLPCVVNIGHIGEQKTPFFCLPVPGSL